MKYDEWTELCAFFRRSRYDVIQVWEDEKWERPWTFASSDVHAAERVGRQIRRVYGSGANMRHARKARLRIGVSQRVDAVIVTYMPSLDQVVVDLETARPIRTTHTILDESMRALLGAANLDKIEVTK